MRAQDNATETEDMKVVLDLGGRGKWLEIESSADANRACLLTGTAIHGYYEWEAEREEGRHPRRWFVLAAPDGVGRACLAVAPPGAETLDPDFLPLGCHVTGYRNENPYPEYAADIEALAEEIGVPIRPNYMGRPLEDIPEQDSPSP